MIELDDCGREILLSFGLTLLKRVEHKITMVIKAPRGTMVIFEPNAMTWDTPVLGWTKQTGAIKAFMEEHKDEN